MPASTPSPAVAERMNAVCTRLAERLAIPSVMWEPVAGVPTVFVYPPLDTAVDIVREVEDFTSLTHAPKHSCEPDYFAFAAGGR